MNSTERIFLSLEQPGYPIDVVGIFMLAGDESGPLPFEHVRQRMATRVHSLPIFWRKVAHAPLGIGEDRWVQAATLNIDDHLRQVTVPAPGDMRAVLDLILELTKDPLDRSLPLWDAWHIEGLADGRTALVLRTHHAVVDGVGGMEVNEALFDRVPVPVDFSLSPSDIQGEPEAGVVTRALREVPDRLAREVVATTRIVKATSRMLATVHLRTRLRRMASAALSPIGIATVNRPARFAVPGWPKYVPAPVGHPPKTLFNRHVSEPDKSFAVIDLPFEHIQQVRAGHSSATVNDVLLTLVTGTLREYLKAHDDLPDRPLWTTCPVNTRIGDETQGEGNNFTTMWVELPVHLDSPRARLDAVHASSAAAKEGLTNAEAQWDALANIGDLLLPGVVHAAMAFAGTPVFEFIPPTLNLTVSTMRGPRMLRYFAGRKIDNFYGRMIICPPVHLFFHSVTYDGMVEFGVTSVKQLVPDPDVLAEGLRRELDRLLAAIA